MKSKISTDLTSIKEVSNLKNLPISVKEGVESSNVDMASLAEKKAKGAELIKNVLEAIKNISVSEGRTPEVPIGGENFLEKTLEMQPSEIAKTLCQGYLNKLGSVPSKVIEGVLNQVNYPSKAALDQVAGILAKDIPLLGDPSHFGGSKNVWGQITYYLQNANSLDILDPQILSKITQILKSNIGTIDLMITHGLNTPLAQALVHNEGLLRLTIDLDTTHIHKLIVKAHVVTQLVDINLIYSLNNIFLLNYLKKKEKILKMEPKTPITSDTLGTGMFSKKFKSALLYSHSHIPVEQDISRDFLSTQGREILGNGHTPFGTVSGGGIGIPRGVESLNLPQELGNVDPSTIGNLTEIIREHAFRIEPGTVAKNIISGFQYARGSNGSKIVEEIASKVYTPLHEVAEVTNAIGGKPQTSLGHPSYFNGIVDGIDQLTYCLKNQDIITESPDLPADIVKFVETKLDVISYQTTHTLHHPLVEQVSSRTDLMEQLFGLENMPVNIFLIESHLLSGTYSDLANVALSAQVL